MSDKSEFIRLPKWAYILNWRNFRFISVIPVLQISWGVFLGTVFLVNTIKLLNAWQKSLPETYSIPPFPPVPEHAIHIIISSLCLSIGTLLYRLRCPSIVKEFSEDAWLYEHKHPRQIYLIKTFQNPISIVISLILLLVGGFWALGLIILRTASALFYIWLQQ